MLFSTISIFAALTAVPSALGAVGVHCGTTSDATLSDCQALVNPSTWDSAWAGGSNVCHYSNPNSGVVGGEAYNVACTGNCCVYVAGADGAKLDKEKTRSEAAGLLGCADVTKNKVNGLNFFEDGHGVCLSDGNGCGDCFDGEGIFAMTRHNCQTYGSSRC